MRKVVVASLFLLLNFTVATTYSASFDCKKAGTEVEKMICANTELSKIDEELATLYRMALKWAGDRDDEQLRLSRGTGMVANADERESVQRDQKAWLRSRNGCRKKPCVMSRYEKRKDELEHFVRSAARAAGAPEEDYLDRKASPKTYRIKRNNSNWPMLVRACRDFADNLNEFPAWPPMICERKLSPKYPQFRRPLWREWNENEIWERREILRSIDKPTSEREWEKLLRESLKAKQIAVNEATDIPRGGGQERWIRYEHARLPASDSLYAQWQYCTGRRYYAKLAQDGTEISPQPGGLGWGPGDFLIYIDVEEGETHMMESWRMEPPFKESVVIVGDEEGCVIEYRAENRAKKGTQR